MPRPFLLALVLTAPSLAQGGDTCAVAQPVLGTGSMPLSLEGMTDSGFDHGTCFDGYGAGIDTWFEWSVPHDGSYLVSCEDLVLTSWDLDGPNVVNDADHFAAQLHVIEACGGACIGSTFDTPPFLQPVEVFLPSLQAGDTYWIRVHSPDAGICAPSGTPGMVVCDGWSHTRGTGDLVIASTTHPNAVATVCAPAANHHEGDAVQLGATWHEHPFLGFHVEATHGPTAEFGFLLLSFGAGQSLPVFEGTLCLDSPIARLNAQTATGAGVPGFDSIGIFDPLGSGVFASLSGNTHTGTGYDLALGLPPILGGGALTAGDEVFVQLWYRDEDAGGAPSANFSDGVRLTVP
jgi:hypothetical protein